VNCIRKITNNKKWQTYGVLIHNKLLIISPPFTTAVHHSQEVLQTGTNGRETDPISETLRFLAIRILDDG
jgi:hypothetical protein